MALLSLSFLSMNRPTLSCVDTGLHCMSEGESSVTLDSKEMHRQDLPQKNVMKTVRFTDYFNKNTGGCKDSIIGSGTKVSTQDEVGPDDLSETSVWFTTDVRSCQTMAESGII